MIDLPPISKLWMPSKPAIIRASSLPKREDFRRGSFMPGFRRAVRAPELTFLQGAANTATQTTYDFTGQSFGDEHADRAIIVVTGVRRGSAAASSIGSVTIGGVLATELVTQIGDTSQEGGIYLAQTTGTSGTISVVASPSSDRCAIQVYRLLRGKSFTPFDVKSSGSTGASSRSVTLDIPPKGCALAGYMNAGGNPVTWTGLTEDYDATTEVRYSSASDQLMAAETGRTITAAATSSIVCLVAVSFA